MTKSDFVGNSFLNSVYSEVHPQMQCMNNVQC